MAEAAPSPEWLLGTDLQREAQVQSAEISLLAILAAVQAVEKKMEAQAARLQSLEGRAGTAEKKLADCEKTAVEFGNQLEGKWAVLGTLLQEYGLLQRRLENMENLLRNRNFWVPRLPPGSKGETPKGPTATDDMAACFSEQEWGRLDDWQQELCKRVTQGIPESLVSLEAGQPASPPRERPGIKQEEEACGGHQHCRSSREKTPVLGSESWLVSKEKRNLEGEPEGLDPARAAEGGLGKQGLEGDTCGNLPLLRATPSHPAPMERGVVALPPGHQGPGVAAAGCSEQRGQSPARKEPCAPQPRAPHSPRPFPCAPGPPSGAPPSERAYTCAQCGKSFVHQSTLTTHYRTHTGEKPYPCAECPKRFGRLSTLLEHRRTHTGERPFQCAQCQRRFGRLSTLVEHRRTHTGEKPFQCAHCEKRFTRLANLTVHQNAHPGERAFQCAQCGKRFAQKPGFLRHLRGHSQEKRQPCGQCGQSFTCRSWLMRHQGGPASQAAPSCVAGERGSPTDEPPAGFLRGAAWGRPPRDPSAAPGCESSGPEQGPRGPSGSRRLGGSEREGLGGALQSPLSRVKMENAG
ncbi:zinc finger protein 282-like [Talpa occidentalis]|uniref:zinc finger protein 282-like n=1 Tax=Talpa occidentalis TaxID=50954 RepID=UPI00188F1FA3|nr:zinc finger protein 282-like [Talpa occidentalis]